MPPSICGYKPSNLLVVFQRRKCCQYLYVHLYKQAIRELELEKAKFYFSDAVSLMLVLL